MPPATEAWSLNHWSTREVPVLVFFGSNSGYTQWVGIKGPSRTFQFALPERKQSNQQLG